jgi:peptidoglycan/LPS O-acetylase OafA/YrhL
METEVRFEQGMAAAESVLRANPSTADDRVSTGVDRNAILDRIPALDGVRAIAILLVLLAHSMHRVSPILAFMTGGMGVSVFLVLSGYLVTRVMLADEEKTGRLRLGRFYTRRALRIFPAFYVFLATVAILAYAHEIPQPDHQTWLASLFYFRNLAGNGVDTLHLWSLSLEEQFYFCWPVLFLITRTRKRRLGFITVVTLAMTVWRFYWTGHNPGIGVFDERSALNYRPDLRMDTFLIGAAFAIANWNWPKKFHIFIGALCFVIWYWFAWIFPPLYPFATPVTAVILAVMILHLVRDRRSMPWLSARPITLLGTWSYSVYLWQQLFLGVRLSWWSVPALVAIAACSYYLVERPFLRLKDANGTIPFAPPKSASITVRVPPNSAALKPEPTAQLAQP